MRHHELTPIILIIPGPTEPKELDTFLRPLVDELNQLDCETKAFDVYTGSR